jgi:conjugal transfer pilus assembly protein TraU
MPMRFWVLLQLKLVVMLMISFEARAIDTCHGKFINPVTDICWRCMLPISIGNIAIGKGATPAKRDRPNPSSPICGCSKAGQVVPVPGITIGFWEPVRLIDVTRTPYCMVNLGMQLGGAPAEKITATARAAKSRSRYNSFFHVHYYVFPIIYWLELLTDFACLEKTTFDVAYMSELDPSWNDPELQTLLNPEAILFGNPLAQGACALDCSASTLDMPLDSMFWCAGCSGNMYPGGGWNADHEGGVQTSNLLASRVLAKMHRLGLAKSTSTTDASINGAICRKETALKLKKSQYKLQMLRPKSTGGSGDIGCWPLGASDLLFSHFKEYPYDGQDWGYLVWRKKNCCLF